MSLETMEQRTEGMKRQAQELIDQAYQRGFNVGRETGFEDWKKTIDSKLIEQGHNEAWEAADRLNRMSLDEVIEVFADDPLRDTITRESIFSCCTPELAIRKLREYDERKKREATDKISVGDEVVDHVHGSRGIVLGYYTNGDIHWLTVFMEGFSVPQNVSAGRFVKTGKRYDIMGILKKMQEDEE